MTRRSTIHRVMAGTVFAAAALSCVGTTGGGLVTFNAYASGPADAASPLVFDTGTGFHVTLTTATMHIGAVYLTATPANLSSQDTSCIEPGRYLAEVPGGVDVDLLSPAPQAFAVQGDGSIDVAVTGEIWLTNGDVNDPDDSRELADGGTTAEVVTLAGIAARAGSSWPFEASVTIGDNRLKPVSDPALPGLNPICKRRIVVVSPIDTPVRAGSALYVRVDPRALVRLVDFSELDLVQSTPTPLYQIPDSDDSPTTGATAGRNLLTGILTAGTSSYSFTFQ
jgi:hypothetical protein